MGIGQSFLMIVPVLLLHCLTFAGKTPGSSVNSRITGLHAGRQNLTSPHKFLKVFTYKSEVGTPQEDSEIS